MLPSSFRTFLRRGRFAALLALVIAIPAFGATKTTTTSVSAAPTSPSKFGQSVTFTATVSSSPSPGGGTVTFTDTTTATTLCSGATLNGSSQATCTSSSLSAVTHSVQATYGGFTSGATTWTSSSGSVSYTVNKGDTTTALNVTPNPSALNQTVTMTATVTVTSPAVGTPSGNVTFFDSATILGSVAVNGSGVATLTKSDFSAGAHSITATYGGDGSFNGSTTSSATSLTVDAISRSLSTVSSDLASVPADNSSIATITVTLRDGAGAAVSGHNVSLAQNGASTISAASGPSDGSGVVTFTVKSQTAQSVTYTATDTTASVQITQQPSVTFTPGAATHFTVSGPASIVAGTATSVTITARDQFENVATGYTGTIHLTSTDGQAVLPADYTFTGGDAGVKSRTVTLRTAGAQTVTATDTGDGSINGTSGSINVLGAAAASLTVSAPANATAGSAISVSVTAKDSFGNTATSYTGTVHFTSTDGSATLPANYTFTLADGGVKSFSVTLKTAGSRTVTATDTVTGSINGTSGAISVAAAAATTLTVSAPATATAGNSINVTVTAKDPFGNTDTGYSGTVHFTSTDAQGVLPSDSTLTSGTGTFPVTLKTSGSRTVTATDTVTGSINGTSGAITVAAAAAQTLTVSAPATATAGTSISVTVTAKDAFNNTATTYAGTVHFTSTDGAAVLPANYTFVAGDNGTKSFSSVQLKTAGTQTVTATDTVTATITGTSGNVTVNPAAATHFSVATPASTVAGVSFSATVTALDAFNNTATGYTGTVHFTSNDAQAVVPSNYTFTGGDAGVKAFSVTLKTVGSRTVTATDTVTASINGTSSNVTVTPAAAVSLTVTAPATATAGNSISVSVTAKDPFGNTDTNYAGTVHFTSNDAQAVLPGDTTLASGTGSFATTLKTSGNRTVTGTDTVTASITGTTGTINVSPAAAASFTVSAPASATAGVSFNVTVTAKDAFNNTATGYAGTVHFTSSDGAAVLPANSTLTSGAGTFAVTLKTAGSRSVTATDTVTASITGSANVTVNPAAAASFTVSAPGSTTAGSSFSVTVTAKDSFNNVATGYAGTVHFTSTDGAAVLPSDATLTSGTGTFSATLKTAGSRTITATDTVTASINGTSGAITVNPAAAASFTVSAPGSATAGTSFSVTVTAKDTFNNTATAYAGTVHFTTSDVQGVPPADTTLTAGTGTFSATLKTAGVQTVTAADTATPAITGTSGNISVAAATATQLAFTTQPGNATAGSAFGTQPVVKSKDAFGNDSTVGLANNQNLTIAIQSGTGTLQGTATINIGNNGTPGIATFSGLRIDASGAKVLRATASGLTLADSNSFNVSPAATSTLVVSAPASTVAGVGFNVTVTANDAFGNTTPAYAGTVHLTSNDSQAVLAADSTLTSGSGTFAVTLKTAGSRSVVATDTVSAGINGTTNVTVNPAAAASLNFGSVPASVTAGSAFTMSLTARDAFGNVATGYTGTVAFTKTDSAATVPANYTFTGADAGVHSFTSGFNLKTAGGQTITATDAANSLAVTTSSITVNPAATSTYAITGAPASTTAGSQFSITVTAKDQFGNTTPGYAGTVHFTSNDGAAVLPGNSGLTSGTGTFNVTLKTSGARTVVATDTVTSSITATANVTVNPAATSTLTVTAPASSTAGTSFSLTVTAKDQFGNTTPGYAGTVHLSSTDGQAILAGDSTLTSGTKTYAGVTLKTAGGQSITATDTVTGTITGSANVTVSAAAATQLVFTTQPGNATAGAIFGTQPVVKSQDAFGNDSTVGLANNQSVTIALTTGTGTLQGTTSVAFGANAATPGVATFTNLRLDVSGAKVLTASSGSLTDAVSNSFTVNPGATTNLVVSAPASTVAGVGITATVTAKDAFGNTTPAYAGTVHITSNDGQAVLPSDNTLTAGVGTFGVTLKTAGSRSVVATDTVTGSINGTTNVTVNPAAAASLNFGSVPASVTAGSAFTMSLTAHDAFGNVATGYTGTVAFTKTDSAATVPANYTFTGADAGVHSFTSGFNLKTAGGQTITATDAANSLAVTTSSITVNPAATSTYAITGAPASSTAGSQFSITVTAKDQFGNTTPGYAGTVHFTSNDGAAVLPGNSGLTSGTGTFNVTLKTSGARTVVATDTVTSSITATANVTVNPAATSTLTVTAPASSTAGTSFSLTVTAKDQFGNTTPAYAGTVHLSSTDGQAILAGDSTLTSGTKTYAGVTLKTAGGQSITATDTVDGTITGSANVTVSAAAATQLVFTTQPGNATAGAIFGTQPVVKSEDAFGNPSTVGLNNNQSVTIALTTGSGALQGTTSVAFGLHASNPGVATFTDLRIDDASDAKQLTASTGGLTSGVSSSFNVSPAATSTFALTMPASSTAGNAFNVTVTAKDQFGNTTPAYSGTVHITSNDGQAVLPADNTLTSGAGIFAVTLKTAGTKSVVATDTVSASITKSQNVAVSAAAPAMVNKTAGDGATLAADASETATVQVVDAYGNAVPATNVAFVITAGNGKANASSSANVSTNASGIASVTWTMGPVAGANTMTATAGSASATFNATGTCTFTTKASGDWNTPSTWVGECVPTASDAATIASGHTITVSSAAQAASLTFAAASADTTLSISGTAALTVAGAVTFNVPASNQTTETLAVGAGTLNAGSIMLNGSGGQKVTQLTVSTGTINVSGSMTFPGNPPTQKLTATGAAHINIGGNFNTGGTLTLDPTSTTTFNGTVAQTIGTYNPNNYFGNLVIANTSAPVTAAGALGGAGTFTINSGATFNASSVNLTLLGNFVDNGTFTAGSGTVAATGTAAQTFSGSASPINFNSLTVNNAAGLTISTPVTVSGAFNLTAGIVSTGSMSITLGSAATTTRGTGYVVGNFAKTYAAAGSKTFEVGTANGYSPATVNATAGSFPATMLVTATQGAHPNAPGSDSLKRYWTLSGNGISSADLSFNYLAGDVVGTESAYAVGRFVSGNVWSYPAGTVDAVNHVGTATGVTTFGDFTLNQRASKLSVTSVNGGTSPVAGAAFNVSVASTDGNGNPVAVSNTTTVSLSVTTGTGTLGGTVTGNINAGSSSVTLTGLTYTKAETGVVVTAAATAGDTLTSAASAPFDVVAGPLDHFLVESASGGNIAPQAAGTAFNIRITAQDAYNNTVTGFTGTVALTSNATMTGAPLTTANFTAGVLASQPITITSAQTNVTISANDSQSGKNGTSNAFTVNPAGAATLLVEAGSGGNIAPQIAGNAFAVRITVKDSFGNVVPSFTGTVDLTSNAGTVAPLNVVFGAADNGVKTANVTLTQANAAATLTGTSGQTTGTSNAFVVSSAGAANFLVEAGSGGSIAPQTAGTAFSIRVTARDGFGNTATGYTGSVTLSTNAGTIAPTPLVFAAADNGVKVLSVTVTQSGAGKTITATDASSNNGTSNAFTVNAGALHHFVVEAAAGGNIPAQNAGASFAIKVTALDANGNVVTGFNGAGNTVDITSSGTLSQGGGTTATFSNGILASHTVAVTSLGSVSITATKTGGAASGTSNSFSVTAGALDHFLVEAAAGGNIPAQNAGASFAIKVTALDVNGNVVTGFNGAGNSVDITSSGTLSQGGGTTATFVNGVLASHTVAIISSGSTTITATKTGGTATGTSNSFTVTGADVRVTGNGPATLLPGSLGTYNFTVTNNGPSSATGVSLALALPATWTVASATAPCAAAFPCAIGTLNPSASASITVQVSVPFGAGANTPFTVGAAVSSTTVDPVPANNSATVQTTVPIVTCPTPVARATPQEGTTSVPLNGALTWIGGNADSYTVYLGPQGTGCTTAYATTSATSFNYSGLSPNTTYEWRIVANRPGCAPVSSSCGTFTTGAACGDTPTLVASAIAEVRSGSTYHVYWNGAGTSYELQESATSDFASPTSQVGLASGVAFSHTVTAQTAFYYRVRFISPCHSVDERVWSETVRVVVQPPQPESDNSFDIPVENGSSQTVGQIVQLTAPAGKDALATTVIGDRSWLTLTPAGGASQPNGVRYLVTVNPAGLPEGTSTGTLRLVDGNGNTLGSASISVQSLLPLETRGKTSTANNGVVILGVAHADGFNSRWQSDVRIYNPAASPTQYDLFFTPSRVDGTKTGRRSSVTVPARETVALDDIVRHVFGYGVMGNESATGALEIRPRQNDGTPALVSSRTYNVTPTGTFGQFVPAVAIPQFAGSDTTLSLQQVAHSAAYRTNFGLVEGTGNTTDVVVRIFDDAGSKRAEVPVTLQPFEHRQIDGLLGANNLQLDDARIEVSVTSPNGRVAAYASVVDNRSNDPLLVTGVNPKKVVADRYIVPGVADYTTPAAHWLTDLRIYNPNAASAAASVVFMGDGGTTLTKSVTIAPGEVKAYNSVVSSLFGKENIGGVVHVIVSPSMSLVVTARTYDGKGAGTYGQFIPAVTASEGAALGSPALQLLQVEQSARYRANIGFTEVAGKTAKVQIDAVAADGRTGSMTIDLAAYEYRQLGSLLRALNLDDAYNARVTIRVIGGDGRVVSYASVIDNQTQDPTYIPAQ